MTESATQITRIDHRRGLPDRVLRNAQGTLKDSTSPTTIINKSHQLLQVQYCSTLQSKMLYIFLTLLSILVVSKCEIANVTVNTSKGTIIGIKRDGYSVFFGVPYAKVNEDNPFGSYLVHPIFQDPFFANDSSIFCPQVTTRFGGTLQCLRLNIYVPNTANVNSTVPVLVWFYGGGFTFGSAQEYGGEHLIKHGIIVVTVNYRLGPYGFMCLNDAAVPGNQGLKDQIGALRWVRKNIEFFGGDPTKVTIAGQSYGGGAVDLHLYSKYETLFEKVIIQSGSLYTPGFYGNRDHDAAIKLAHQLGFRVANTREALEALGKENPVLVMNAAKNLGYKMTVCKEVRFKGTQQFVTKCINHLSNPDRIENIPIMIGYNSKEDFATYANKPMEFFDSLGDIFYKNLQNHFVLKTCELETLSNITKSFYLGSKRIGPESILELSEYSSDFKLNYAVEKSVSKFLEQGGRVYKYMFSYIGGSVYQNITGAGAVHTEELKYLFETGVKLTSDEQRLRNRMTTMWTNFVKLGNPTPQKTPLLPVTWTPVSGNARQYLNIDIGMSMKDYAYRHRMAFWDLFMQKYDKKS
ncbi:juvenile hormone esterase-like [Spodoptera litura]|uniref:Juvenile hormone esterase-like n=1 Tax=Spodoptera litura TaxID=69820 RepID=A0A9J7DY07_SPOLT|nr:juvenile hormone esterase-like [Spodoptera litura]